MASQKRKVREEDGPERPKPLDLTLDSKKSTADDPVVETNCKKVRTDAEENAGIKYPMDLWYLLSEYIAPEDVGRFSRLCKDAQYVVDRPKFWISLYKRYCTPVYQLPPKLLPSMLNYHRGLRTRVIQALHLIYEPLYYCCATRVHLSRFEGREIIFQWQQLPASNGKYFYFLELEDTSFRTRFYEGTDCDGFAVDLSENPRDARMLFKITCSDLVQMPILVKLVLRKIKYVPAHPYVRECSILIFELEDERDRLTPTFKLKIPHVTEISYFHWWNPGYQRVKKKYDATVDPPCPQAHVHPITHPVLYPHDECPLQGQITAQPLALVKRSH